MRLPNLGVARLALLKRSGSADGALNAAPYDTAANPAKPCKRNDDAHNLVKPLRCQRIGILNFKLLTLLMSTSIWKGSTAPSVCRYDD